MDGIYMNGIKPAIEDCGYEPVWLKPVQTIDRIDDLIFAEIRRSRFVVSDFTKHRNAVYFEAGFAMGLAKPVVWTCKEGEVKKSSFDTRQYNHIVWKDSNDLRGQLTLRIKALNL